MRRRHLLIVPLLSLLLPCAPDAGETAASPDTTELAALSAEELFVRASSSELQFGALVAPSRRLLVKEHAQTLPYLLTHLDTDDVRERIALEDVLVKIGAPAVGPLTEALRREAERTDVTRGVRLAAYVLGRIGDPAPIDALVAAGGHRDWKVRGAVTEALGMLGRREATTSLVALIKDENEIVRKSAAVALGRVGEKSGTEPRLDADAVDALIVAMSDPFYSVRYSAEGALAATGGPAVSKLVRLAVDGAGEARALATMALGNVRSRQGLGTLRALVGSPDWRVKAYAIEALGKIGLANRDRRALERLLESDQHPFVVLKAKEALAAPRG
jgi:HEAT repeat protein